MEQYQTLLFDVDDTLLDFQATERMALRMLFEEHHFTLTSEIEDHYKKINQGLWEEYEEGKMDRDEVVNTRFSTLFENYGKKVDGALLEKSYRSYLGDGHQLVSGAIELIKDLHTNYDLFIVTNGMADTQDKRLHDSGLHSFFKDIFVSESTGFQKPMKEFFDYVFARIPNFDPRQALIIGDSLSSDIRGGTNAGIDTCWFNPVKKSNKTDIIPTYEIQNLEDLYQLLKVKQFTK